MAYRDPFVLPATPEQKTRAQKIKQVRRTHGGGGGEAFCFFGPCCMPNQSNSVLSGLVFELNPPKIKMRICRISADEVTSLSIKKKQTGPG